MGLLPKALFSIRPKKKMVKIPGTTETKCKVLMFNPKMKNVDEAKKE